MEQSAHLPKRSTRKRSSDVHFVAQKITIFEQIGNVQFVLTTLTVICLGNKQNLLCTIPQLFLNVNHKII